jgi:integrase
VAAGDQAAGLDGLRIHDLRHTAVALWIAAGANPKEVAARAGHASVSFTLDRYATCTRRPTRHSGTTWTP